MLIAQGGANPIELSTNGVVRVYIKDDGSVGIGTTAPNIGSVAKALTISAGISGTNQAFLELQGSRNSETNKVFAGIEFFNGLNNTVIIGGVRETADDDGALSFYTKKTLVSISEKMRITGDGNVGIGTTAPTSKLQVVGLPIYANNAAALAGGLTAGAFYRTGGDPDPVCVVH